MSSRAIRPSRGAITIAGFAVVLLAAVVFALLAGNASGKAADILGKTSRTPKPLCPKNCLITGSVTGFQTVANGEKKLFTVPSDGHIVAWSADLGNPDKDQTESANKLFDDERYNGQSVARLSILKPQKRSKFKLVKQSPVQKLKPKFGTTPIFTLGKPLKVMQGVRVAITVPTWGPFFKNGLSQDDNQWIVSRPKRDCEKSLTKAKPHQKVGTTRSYGCRFSGERILYNAYFVPARSGDGGN